MRCECYYLGCENRASNSIPAYVAKDGVKVLVLPGMNAELGILVKVDAVADTGKVITASHGELITGQWVEVIDQQLTQVEITAGIEAARLAAEPPAVTALKSILQDEITVLNAKYTGLELLITDSPAQAIPKLLMVQAQISDCNRIDLLYRYILEAGK
jgi:hypothetical protein